MTVPLLQDWLTDEDVSKWLNKYDWDSSGDISFNEFQALVRIIAETLAECAQLCWLGVNSCWLLLVMTPADSIAGRWRRTARRQA